MDYGTISKKLSYDLETGHITWICSMANNVKRGNIAGCKRRDGYIIIGINGKQYFAHRLAWLLHYKKWPKLHIDHINHDPSDNRMANLREVTHNENLHNASLSKANKSGCCGVFWHNAANKWLTQITTGGEVKYLGLHADWWDAVCARKDAEHDLGFYFNHGRNPK